MRSHRGDEAQRLPVAVAFGHGQTVVMRFDPACQNEVSVDHQMMGGDRRGQIVIAGLGILHAVSRGDMFHDHAQPRRGPAQRIEHALNKDSLAVEDVDIIIGDLAVDA